MQIPIEIRIEIFIFDKVQSYKIFIFLAEVCNGIGNNVYTCCSLSNQCDVNQGDCDSDSECSGYLVCGNNNCQSPFPTDADCCKLGKFTTLLGFGLKCKICELRLH